MSSKKKVESKAESFNKEKSEQTLKAASSLTVENAVKKLTEVNLNIGKTLSDVGQQISQQVNEFQTISHAVQLKKEELENLHDKDLVLKEIEELQSLKATAQEDHDNKVAELEEDLKRQTDQREYDFSIQTRQKNDELGEEIRVKKLEERNRQDELARNWKAREDELKAKETEFVSYKTQVEGFPAKLSSEVKREVAIAENSIKREYEHRIQLLEKDKATSAQIALAEITNLKDINTKLATQLAAAELRIAESEKNVKSIAEKALETSGSQKTLSELQMMQNAPNGSSRSKQA